jgi:hypothetical protein
LSDLGSPSGKSKENDYYLIPYLTKNSSVEV